MALRYNAIITFQLSLEAYTVKLGRNQVLDSLQHSGSDPQTLRRINATVYVVLCRTRLYMTFIHIIRSLADVSLILCLTVQGRYPHVQSARTEIHGPGTQVSIIGRLQLVVALVFLLYYWS